MRVMSTENPVLGLLPAKTPKDLVATVRKAAVTTLGRPEVARRLEELGFVVLVSRGDELESHVKNEIEKYAKLIRQVGMPLQ